MTEKSSSPRDAMRTKLLAQGPVRSKRITVDGVEVEIRIPTVKARRAFTEQSKGDPEKFNVLAVIACTFIPETDTRVFEPQDEGALLEQETGGKLDVLSHVLGVMLGDSRKEAEAAAKN